MARPVNRNADPSGPTLEERFWTSMAGGLEQLVQPGPRLVEYPMPDIHRFIRDAWHVVEPATEYHHNWHIDCIADHLLAVAKGEILRLIINIPPRHMKSLLVSVLFPVWLWTWRPHTRFLWASYSGALSTRDSVKCRRIIESAWYQANWGHVFQLSSDQNVKTRFENTATGVRLATSVGGAGTGEGGDIVCVDDAHKVDEVESQVEREGVVGWWKGEMSTRFNNPKTGAAIIVGQRTHDKDLPGVMADEESLIPWQRLVIPAEYEPKAVVPMPLAHKGWKDPRTEPGELLWESRIDRLTLDDLKRTLGSYRASAQLQQMPTALEGGIFKRFWWKYYVDAPPAFDEVLQSWDFTFKKTDDTDFVVGQVWGRLGADAYLLDEVRARMDFPDSIAAILALTKKWPQARRKLVEDKANGPAIISTLKKKIPGLIAVEPEGDKVARANAVTYLAESGNVYLPDPKARAGREWVVEWVEEVCRFDKAAYDDRVDAFTQAMRRMFGKVPVPKGRIVHF